MRYVSFPMSQKAATLNQFTFAMSNYNCCSLSGLVTQLNNHYTLYMNSLKDHHEKFTSFLSKILCSYRIGYVC